VGEKWLRKKKGRNFLTNGGRLKTRGIRNEQMFYAPYNTMLAYYLDLKLSRSIKNVAAEVNLLQEISISK
jgi:hypothetical protein